jgi:nitroreductase
METLLGWSAFLTRAETCGRGSGRPGRRGGRASRSVASRAVELDAVIARRRMCRSFLDRPLPAGTVDRLLDRARRAPSAGHTQGWDWLVLEGSEQTGRFWHLDADPAWLAAPDHPGLLRAPLIVIPLAGRAAYEERYAEADKPAGATTRWNVPYWMVDTAFATMLLLLATVEEGLGALLFALHADARVTMGAFGVPPDREPLGAVAIGWPDPHDRPGSSASRPRRPLDDQVHRGFW